MVFNLFRRKEKEDTQMPLPQPAAFPEFSAPVQDVKDDVLQAKDDMSFDDLDDWGESGSPGSASLETFYRKIDLEAEDLERRVADIKKKTKNLDLNNPELVDLLNLYEKARGTVDNFIREIDKMDTSGWGVDDNTSAIYKFRACKRLSQMKQRLGEIERMTKQAGFTNSKVTEILHTPAEQLVNTMNSRKRK